MKRKRKVNNETSSVRSIKQWPVGERPREKLRALGPDVLSEAELLGILIRTGMRGQTALDLARNLLAGAGSLTKIAQMDVRELGAYGIGPARAAAIVAAFELSRRIPRSDGKTKPVFRSPGDVAERYSSQFKDLRHEEFWVLLLNSANQLIRHCRVTQGTLNTSLVHPRECFHEAIKEKAASVIFIHNHPSGNPEPSQEDMVVTKQLVDSGKILGIPVHDHIILAGSTFVSFAERGLL